MIHVRPTRRALAFAGLAALIAVALVALIPAPRPNGDPGLGAGPSAPRSAAPTSCPSEPPGVAPGGGGIDEGTYTPPPSVGPSTAPWPPHPLTPRLLQLADPAIAGLPLAERAERLGLRVDGPSSLVVRPCGRILVSIRVSDTSPATLVRLVATGAQLEAVNDVDRSISAAVAPWQLTALAAVPEVWLVSEVVTPPPGHCDTELGVCIW